MRDVRPARSSCVGIDVAALESPMISVVHSRIQFQLSRIRARDCNGTCVLVVGEAHVNDKATRPTKYVSTQDETYLWGLRTILE